MQFLNNKPFPPHTLRLEGKTFGRWEVLGLDTTKPRGGKTFWICRCACGTVRSVVGTKLRIGKNKSCGCAGRLRPFESLYRGLLVHALQRGIACSLSYEQFLTFTKCSACVYCGQTVDWGSGINTRKTSTSQAHHLDRTDGSLGYDLENCVVCCKTCNYMKYVLDAENFLKQVARIYQHRRLGLSISAMAQEAWDNAEAHGFHEAGVPPLPESLMLIVSEAAEALEDDRKGLKDLAFDEKGKPTGVGQELADIIIRVGHTAVLHGIDLEAMTIMKQRFNRSRPHKHGKKY